MGRDQEAVLHIRTADNIIPPDARLLHFGSGGKIPAMPEDPAAAMSFTPCLSP